MPLSAQASSPPIQATRPLPASLRRATRASALSSGRWKLKRTSCSCSTCSSVAQALLKAEKIAIIRQRLLRCAVSYPLEGLVRRELELAGAALEQVEHGEQVQFTFQLPDDRADAFISRLNESGSGRIAWIGEP